MKFTRIHLALVAATSMSQGLVMAETSDSDVGTIGVQGKATGRGRLHGAGGKHQGPLHGDQGSTG